MGADVARQIDQLGGGEIGRRRIAAMELSGRLSEGASHRRLLGDYSDSGKRFLRSVALR
jgi:hypothetical protein